MNKHFRVLRQPFRKVGRTGNPCVCSACRTAGLPPGLFRSKPRVLVTTEELFALWRAIGEVSPDPAIGLLLGTETKTERFDPVGLAALSTENFGEAMRPDGSLQTAHLSGRDSARKHDDEWSIQFRWLLADEVEPAVLIECCFAWVLSVARHGTGTRVSPLRVEFVRPRAHVKTIERHFGCPIICGAPRNAIVFRAIGCATALRYP